MSRYPHSYVLVGLGWSQAVLVRGEQVVGDSSMGHAQGKARSKGTSLQPGVWSDKAKRMEVSVLSRVEGATLTQLRHQPPGLHLDPLMRMGS